MARCASRLVRAATVLALGAATVAVPIGASPAAAQGSALLPPLGDCAGATPIVVASDTAAQSDVYSAVTLAGVLDAVDPDSGACIVLAGHRDETMPAAQSARLETARGSGYVVGGIAAVSDEKAPSGFTRIAGDSRWTTARNIGIAAFRLARGNQPDAAAFPSGTGHGASATANSPALPPLDDCSGATPIVVASDLAAQSDIYSAVTLAGVLNAVDPDSRVCIVLAGHRGETMPPTQSANLNTAVDHGYVVGGTGAVVQAKAPRVYRRVAGSDRWATARAVGAVALETAAPSLDEQPPSSRAVVERAEVDPAGATVAAGSVEVTVPPGALSEDAIVQIRAPLGRVGHLIGGDIVEIEHTQPINQPVTVVWDVSELNEFQQAVLVVVRRDHQEERWRAVDAEYEIVNDRLTAHLDQWSDHSWISSANQWFGEKLGVKVKAPDCAGPIPGWLDRADDPDEHSDSASIRLCYEEAGGHAEMKTANNRNISRLLYPTGNITWTSSPSSYSSIADFVVGHTFGRWLENDIRVYFLPLQTRHIQLHQPQTSGRFYTTFRTPETTGELILADIAYSILEQLELPVFKSDTLLKALNPFLECAFIGVLDLTITGRSSLLAIGQHILDCFKNPQLITEAALAAAEVDIQLTHQGFLDAAKKLAKGIEAVQYLYRITDSFKTPEETWTVSAKISQSARDPQSTQGSQAASTYRSVSVGDHSCGVRSDATVICWGPNSFGSGDAPSGSFTSVSVGSDHSCGVRTDATVTCWGNDRVGNMDVPTGSFTSVSAGDAHSCGVRTDATVTCWGWNSFRSGDAPSGSFTSVSAGNDHSCGVRTDATVTCWGSNGSGQSDAPTGSFTSVSAGGLHSCGVRTDATVTCWGWNKYGQTDAPSGTFTSVSAGFLPGSFHACALRTDATVTCWGWNKYGQTDAPSGTFTSVSAGRFHSCGVRTDATVTCWGWNKYGQTDAP